ncbi:GNAT family N-acetyltransferase [Castellaniella daejeonensis]|jgi:phosphinothricin acetyltransferase|uniref:GNAT family N-acetyltransferase n=2 Tax=Castellaniella daejeonensis TaxID=659013 RepID=A0ABN0U1Y0_9BURK
MNQMLESNASGPDGGIRVRDAADEDIAVIQAIYAHHVLNGISTFEEIPPSVDEMASRRDAIIRSGLPYLVAEVDGRVVGYCCAAAYRARPAYRYAIENSVYVEDGMDGKGVGSALLRALITRCEAGPWRQMIAVIGDRANTSSIILHQNCGFRHVGILTGVGFKLGQWVDTVLMQRALGGGTGTPPAA